jgi:hypothetical protein
MHDPQAQFSRGDATVTPQSYRERETGVGLLEQGFGLQSTSCGAEVVTQGEGVQVRAALDAPSYRFFQRLWLTVALTIPPGVHLYGQPIPTGYLPLTIEVAPLAGMVVGEPNPLASTAPMPGVGTVGTPVSCT